MVSLLQKGLSLILKRQTNILSAAFVIMATVILSQLLGLVRQRLLVSIFGASDTLGIYLASSRLPDFLFQLIIAGALTSSFIPVFSEFLGKKKYEEAKKMASTLLVFGLGIFAVLGIILFIFAQEFSRLIAPGFTESQIMLMSQLTRIIIGGELLFIVGTFLSAILHSYSHFFIPGIASSLYNLGIISGVLILSSSFGIFSAAYGVLIGASIFVLAQIPLILRIGFSFKPTLSFNTPGVLEVVRLMWPRTLSIAVFQVGTIVTVALISFLPTPGRSYVIFDYAQTLAFAPVVLFGQAIAQAAFPILARERDRLEDFKTTFITSFFQMLYLVLPISVLFIVLRIPVVRLIYGAGQFDWEATVLTGTTLAFFSVSIFAQALIYLISRGFYALHDTRTPLIIGSITTALMILLGAFFVFVQKAGIESIAIAYSTATILNVLILFTFLDRKVGGFPKKSLFLSLGKIGVASAFTGIALYVPIKLLDQLVFDTTRTINLILLTGISSFLGLSFYLFLTWLFNVKEATYFLYLFKKVGDWRQILKQSDEVIDGTKFKP